MKTDKDKRKKAEHTKIRNEKGISLQALPPLRLWGILTILFTQNLFIRRKGPIPGNSQSTKNQRQC